MTLVTVANALRIAPAVLSLASVAPICHAQLVDINVWKQGPEYRAMHLQREMARDMRQDQSLVLGSHNSFNSSAYGPSIYPFQQHSYTLAQQLDLGLRSLDIDVHAIPAYPNELYVTHAVCSGAGFTPGERTLYETLDEIYNWLAANPQEVVILNIEQHFPMTFPSNQHTRMQTYFEDVFGGGRALGDILIRPSEVAPITTSNGDDWELRVARLCSFTLTDLRARGRVLIVNVGGAQAPCSNQAHYWPDYLSSSATQNFMFGNAPSFSWAQEGNWHFVHAKDFSSDQSLRYWGSNSLGSQCRDFDVDFFAVGQDASDYGFLYNNTSCGEYQDYGSEPPPVIREAVRAGVNVVRFDPLGRSVAQCGNLITMPADELVSATIWSWDERYLPLADSTPRAAMAVIEGDTARVRWELPSADMRYALQDTNGEWSISTTHGTFAAAPPETLGTVNFRAPGNGFEMQNLFGHMVRAGITKVWINYHDLDGDGAWTPTTQNRRFFSAIDATPSTLPLAISPVPLLASGTSGVLSALAHSTDATGNVLCVYPGNYAVTPGVPIRLNMPMTIVPAAHGQAAAIGR